MWKRRQRVLKPCESASKLTYRWGLRRLTSGGNTAMSQWQWTWWPGRGLLSTAKVREDSPGTWETRSAPPGKGGIWMANGWTVNILACT